MEAVMIGAGPDFFDTLRIPLLDGCVFDTRDRADTPRVAVVTDCDGTAVLRDGERRRPPLPAGGTSRMTGHR